MAVDSRDSLPAGAVPPVMPHGAPGKAPAAPRRPPALRIAGIPVRTAKILLFVLALYPLARWLVLGFTGGLGVNPIEFLTRSAGTWTFVFLLVTLAITPLRVITRQPALGQLRRMCGLFTFFYASLHLLTYVWFDQWFDGAAIAADVARRPFIALGMAAFVLLLPLAITSTRGWIRRLGVNWQRLHRLIYVIGVLALLHLLLHKAGKNDYVQVIVYGGVLIALLGWRLWQRRRGR